MTHPVRAPGRPVVPCEELPGDPGSLLRDALAFLDAHRARLLRPGLHLVVAALPLLAISAHVFGVAPMNVTAGLVVVPLTLAVLLLSVFSPLGEDRIVLMGAIWGVIAPCRINCAPTVRWCPPPSRSFCASIPPIAALRGRRWRM